MIKILVIFLIGFIEQLLYTAYLLSVNKKQVNASTLLMVAYMAVYLFIISYAIKDSNTIPLLISYALACGLGNWCIMKWESRKKHSKLNNYCLLYDRICKNKGNCTITCPFDENNYCSCNKSIISGYRQSGEYKGCYICGNCLKPIKNEKTN